MKTPHCMEDVDYLTIMSTQPQASWSLRTDKVNLVTPLCSFIISPSDTCTNWVWERFDRMWSTGEGNGKPLQYSCLENPMNGIKRQNDRILKDKLPRSVGTQYATGHQWRNNSRKNGEMQPKQKQHPVVDVTGVQSKVRCCKEKYCIGIWNVRSMNQGKLEMVKQEMSRVSINILGISKQMDWNGWI